MAKIPPSIETLDESQQKYMLLNLAYDSQFILPMNKALAIVEALSSGLRYVSKYKEEPRVEAFGRTFELRPVTENELASLIGQAHLYVEEDDD